MKFTMGQQVLDTTTGKIVKVLDRYENSDEMINVQYPAGDIFPVAAYSLFPLEGL